MSALCGRRAPFPLAVALAMAAAIAPPVAAQEGAVRVRGGEHAAYSRIVIDAPKGARFAWGVAGETLTLTLPGLTRPLALGAVAQGRGLSRVSAASAGAGALSLTLACDCGAQVGQLADGRIVIDVAEGAPRPAPPASGAGQEAAPLASPPQSAAATPSPQGAAPSTAPAARAAPAPIARPARPSAPRLAESAAPPPAPEATAAARPPTAQAARPAAEPPETAQTPAADMPPERAPDITQTAEAAPVNAAAGTESPAAESPATESPATESPEPKALPSTDQAAPASAAPDLNDPVAALRAALRQLPEAQAAPPEAPPATAEQTAAATQAASIEDARRRLLQQLTKAAEEGLLTLSDRTQPPTPPALDPLAEGAAAPVQQLRARNALDIANERAALAPAPPPALPENCLGPEHFAIADWATDAPFDEQVGPKRRALVGEFDAPMADAVFGYARLLTHFTFGREALAALAAFGDRIAPPPALADMAYVVDRETPPADGDLRKGVGCPGPHGLWAAAAAGLAGALDAAQIDVEALRQPLSVTPPHLRAALVTPIATAALEGGRLEAAEMLAGIAARAEPPLPDGDAMLAILLARLDAERGFVQRAEAALKEIGRQNSPAGIEAMIQLAQMRAARGVAPPKGLAENMEAVAFSLGQSDEGRRLLAVAAQTRAAGEGLAPALAALATLATRAGDPNGAMQAARDMLVDYEPKPEEAAAYAEAALAHWSLVGEGPEGDRARVAVAKRLAAMGIENLAETLLAPALKRGDAAARMAAADAATAAGAPDRALTHLDGVPGPAAARARASALSALGRNAEAAEAAQAAGDPGLAARYAWLAGNWAAASAAGALDRRILAAWMSGAAETPPELLAAAEGDPGLAALAGAFAPPPAPDDGSDLIGAAAQALKAAQERRKLMGGLLGDG